MAKLKSIAFENFRAFEKEVIIEIAPITILVGPNGSGKSSVLKIIELLRSNLEKFTLNELRIDLKELELHTYENVLNKNGTSSEMSIAITIAFDSTELFYYLFGETITYKLNYKSSKEKPNKLQLQQVHVTDGFEVFLELVLEEKRLSAFKSNLKTDSFLKNLNLVFDDEFYELFEYICNNNDYSYEHDTNNEGILLSQELIEDESGGVEFRRNGKGIGLSKKMTAMLKFAESLRRTYAEELRSKDIKKLIELSLTDLSKTKWHAVDTHLELRLQSLFYTENIEKERTFNIHENIVGGPQSDFQIFAKKIGIDVEKMLNKLFNVMLIEITAFMKIQNDLKQKRFYPFEDFIKDYKDSYSQGYDREYYLSKEMIKIFNIGDEIIFKNIGDLGVRVKVIKGSGELDLCDIGFGYTRLLPILYLLATRKEELERYMIDIYFILEEPENNLHPSLQSKLADLFSLIIRSEIRSEIKNYEEKEKGRVGLIVETHSEYLIRKLQYLTAKGELKTDDTVIHYFYPPNQIPIGEKQVKKINIRKDGMLTGDFGEGFFDETARWSFELLKLQNLN